MCVSMYWKTQKMDAEYIYKNNYIIYICIYIQYTYVCGIVAVTF